MTHCIRLDWPSFSDAQHQQIIDFLDSNVDRAHRIPFLLDNSREFQNLWVLEEKIDFFSNLFAGHNLPLHILKNTGIQRLSDGTVEPHPDLRQVGLYYLVQGQADSVWYTIDEPLIPNRSYQRELEQGKLTEVQRFRMDLHTWYLYDHRTIHAAQNATGPRISLNIGIDNPQKPTFQDWAKDIDQFNLFTYWCKGKSQNLSAQLG